MENGEEGKRGEKKECSNKRKEEEGKVKEEIEKMMERMGIEVKIKDIRRIGKGKGVGREMIGMRLDNEEQSDGGKRKIERE